MIEKTAALAPMAGVCDRAFRTLCRAYGAAYTVGEMASAKGLTLGGRKTAALLGLTKAERPAAVQIFGDDPVTMAQAAEMALEYRPDAIDINMGCPAPKVAGNGGGSALMRQPRLAGQIVEAVVQAVAPLPVTVKMRKGWDGDSVNAVELAQICEQAGAGALAVHGRTRAQMYAPPADWEIIAQVKGAVSIPVMGNGDVGTPEDAKEMYDRTGCDLVMVGRGALGRPWLFAQIRDYLATGAYAPDPALEERMAVMLGHIRSICEHKGEYVAMREARKHAAWYLTGLRGAAALRRQAGTLSTYQDAEALVAQVLRMNQE